MQKNNQIFVERKKSVGEKILSDPAFMSPDFLVDFFLLVLEFLLKQAPVRSKIGHQGIKKIFSCLRSNDHFS